MNQLVVIITLAIGLVGCASTGPTTPVPPNSPQTQALNVDKALADAINAAVKTAISLRDNGKLSPANTTLIENWAKSAATLDDAIATELGSADPWPVQKQAILVMLPAFKVPGSSTLDTTLQASLNAITALVSQLQAQVTK